MDLGPSLIILDWRFLNPRRRDLSCTILSAPVETGRAWRDLREVEDVATARSLNEVGISQRALWGGSAQVETE